MAPRSTLVGLTALASTALLAAAQTTIPLVEKTFSYPNDIPYRVDTDDGPRGTQQGYNRCNATTEGQESLCQTSFINSIEDFCLWGPPEPNSIVGNTEGEMVAWCTKPGRGTRLIPEGALKGVQFVKAPSYVQVVGFIDQKLINIGDGDYGGEMDPHGADRRGNPLGGIMFSQAFGGGGNSTTTTGNSTSQQWTQVMEWHNFMGADMFCLKACDPADSNDRHFCEHIFDRIGCNYNAPADYGSINGTFSSCASDNQRYPGVYVTNGRTVTYTQPPESLGAISTMPYQPEIPASSECTTYTSAQLYTELAPAAESSVPTSAATTGVASGVTSAAGAAATSGTSAAAPRNAANASPSASSSTGAASHGMQAAAGSVVAGLVGVAGLAMLL